MSQMEEKMEKLAKPAVQEKPVEELTSFEGVKLEAADIELLNHQKKEAEIAQNLKKHLLN